jgi:hypothetical protein
MKILFDANTPTPSPSIQSETKSCGRTNSPALRRVAERIATAADFVQAGQIVAVDVTRL